MLITISGFHGTGKSSIGRRVAAEFNLRYVAAGDLFRQMAKDRHMSLTELSEVAVKNPEIDYEIDRRTLEEAKKGNVILDSLLAAWKIRDISGLHILFYADEATRVTRIAKRENRSYEEVKAETLNREKVEIARFQKLYAINLNDYSVYDIVLNTALWSENTIARIVILLVKEYKKSNEKLE
ncbi:MAG: (d)CMP kinase [Candidatus Helarchaeota archaeon]